MISGVRILNSYLLKGLFFCSLFYFHTNAQNFKFEYFYEDNGLAQNYVYKVGQLKNGFMVLSTGKGLSIYDGTAFKNYTNKNGLPENFVNTHFIKDNKVFIGHLQKGISIYEDGKITKLACKSIVDAKITCFASNRDGKVFGATQGKGLFEVNGKNVISLKHDEISSVNSFDFDSKNNFIIGTNDGLYYCSENKGELKTISFPENFSYKTVKSIVKHSRQLNLFWIAVEGEGLYLVKIKDDKVYVLDFFGSEKLNSVNLNFTDLYFDNEKKQLFASLLGEGIKIIKFDDNENEFKISKINNENSLQYLDIQSVFVDYEGNLWMGTFGNGLCLKPIQRFSYLKAKSNNVFSNIKSILSDDQITFFIGNNQGFYKYNLLTGTSNIIPGINDQVNVLEKDNYGNILIGTEKKGVFIYNVKSESIYSFSKKMDLKSLSINCIETTPFGITYIGTREGLYIFDVKTNNLTFKTTMDGLLHNSVQTLYFDSKKRLWIGSKGTAPYYFKDNNFKIFNDIENLKYYNINSYIEDKFSNIWISTEGDGIYKYNNKEFFRIDSKKGLSTNYSYGFQINENDLWISHKSGLTCLNVITEKKKFYNRNNQLLIIENNLNANYKNKSGILFGATNGLILLSTKSSDYNHQAPILSISDVKFNEQFIKPKDNSIDKKFGRYDVKIFLKAISYSSNNLTYKYKLSGYDDEWKETTDEFVEYSKLPYGKYNFVFVVTSSEGVSSKPYYLELIIQPPFWLRWWFILLEVLIVFLLIYLFVQQRLKKLSRDKIVLQKLVDEKTLLLQEEKKTLEITKNELAKINEDITDSINYSLNIQKAILPLDEQLDKVFSDISIFYLPRDIVSGDFYWFHETEQYYYIAVVDCSGHGIPGAFVSLIGSTLLHEIVVYYKDVLPNEILRLLNEKIIKTLKQDTEFGLRDGMDLVVCAVQKDLKKVIFSSAGRPVLFKKQNLEVETIKGTPYGLGGSYDFIDKSFTNVELDINTGDNLYLFSDGYTDQFGGEKNKKFSTKNVKSMVESISNLEKTDRSKKIADSFFEWKGENHQTDDVLMISIKF